MHHSLKKKLLSAKKLGRTERSWTCLADDWIPDKNELKQDEEQDGWTTSPHTKEPEQKKPCQTGPLWFKGIRTRTLNFSPKKHVDAGLCGRNKRDGINKEITKQKGNCLHQCHRSARYVILMDRQTVSSHSSTSVQKKVELRRKMSGRPRIF